MLTSSWFVAVVQAAVVGPEGRSEVATALRVTGEAPSVDGRLTEPVWQRAPAIGSFVQRDPVEGIPAAFTTEVRVVFTEQAIYVAVRASDPNPDLIMAPLARRDQRPPGDWIGVMLDSQFDRRTAFEFSVNAGGVRRDVYRFNDFEEDVSWDAVWDVAVQRDEQGWTAEFRIPLSQLRFAARTPQRFGFNVYREVGRTHELQHWRLMSRNQRGVVSQFGELSGLDGVRPSRRLEVAPFIAGRAQPAPEGSPRDLTGGADLRFPLTSSVTLAASINPDFGQVEADPAVVNLSATEIFFPERRPLFVEGADYFRFALTADSLDSDAMFYTRRIGAAGSILGATKLLGRTAGGWSVGTMGAVTETEGFLAARLSRDFNDGRTLLGGFGTLMRRDPGDAADARHTSAAAVALTGSHRLGDGAHLVRGLVALSRVAGDAAAVLRTQTGPVHFFQRSDQDYAVVDSSRTSLEGVAAWMEVARDRGPWIWSAKVASRSPEFEVNDAGFLGESGRYLARGNLVRRWLAPTAHYLRAELGLESFWNTDWSGRIISRGGGIKSGVVLRNYLSLAAEAWRNFGGADPMALRGGPALMTPANWFFRAEVATDPVRPLRGRIGAVYRPRDQAVSQEFRIPAMVGIRPSSRFDLELTPSYEWNTHREQYVGTAAVGGTSEFVVGHLRQQTFRIGLRAGFTFTPTLTLQGYAEPFASSGEYAGFSRVDEAGSIRRSERVEPLPAARVETEGEQLRIDLDADGAADLVTPRPDFSILSVRSTFVLRWEYRNGSNVSLVMQHDRNDHRPWSGEEPFDMIGRIGSAAPETRIVLKASYWFML
jgi:hypothetical protein